MSLVKHGDSGKWYYRFSRNGKVHFGSTGETNKVKAAKVEAWKIIEVESSLTQASLGASSPQFKANSQPTLTLQEALIQYNDTIDDGYKISFYLNKLVGANTKRDGTPSDIYALDRDMPLHHLTTADVQRLIMARRTEGFKNATILTELTALNQAIGLAKRLGYAVPVIDFAEIKGQNNVRPDKHRVRFLTKDEETSLLNELNPNRPTSGIGVHQIKQRTDLYHLVICLLDTGARHGEIATLEWKNVDLENGEIHLYRSKVENESILTMTKRVKQALTERFGQKRPDQRFIFESRDGTKARNHSSAAFYKACERAGIEGVSFHTLRHTYASRLIQNEVPIPDVSQLLGHTTIAMTMKYAHLAPNQSAKRAASVLDQLND